MRESFFGETFLKSDFFYDGNKLLVVYWLSSLLIVYWVNQIHFIKLNLLSFEIQKLKILNSSNFRRWQRNVQFHSKIHKRTDNLHSKRLFSFYNLKRAVNFQKTFHFCRFGPFTFLFQHCPVQAFVWYMSLWSFWLFSSLRNYR